ncbi:Zn-ribbon domain-containing OB-fold protein [Nocardioides jensenii]|uniref:Zn-ribbon domain-containing OB-fold protein n=1 Tax=Nocardioides jensenii TaxID=1843 RepID=UPI00083497DF|nr:OB-fold domain-containing protein [Nocardioides jensenii]
MNTTEQVHVVDGLMSTTTDGPRLLGSNCTACSTHYFPQAALCRNPRCPEPGQATEPVELSHRGRLHSITLQSYLPPAPFRMEPWENHVIGLVELPEQVRLLALVVGVAYDDAEMDMEVELTTTPLYLDEQQREVITYAFRPATESTTGASQ